MIFFDRNLCFNALPTTDQTSRFVPIPGRLEADRHNSLDLNAFLFDCASLRFAGTLKGEHQLFAADGRRTEDGLLHRTKEFQIKFLVGRVFIMN